METTELARRVAADTDDVLATISLVRENEELLVHLFDQLVDLLLEGLIVDLRTGHAAGRLSAREYSEELVALAGECREVGLLRRRS